MTHNMSVDNAKYWLSSFDICENMALEIMEKITSRNQQLKNSLQYSKINGQTRIMIKKYNSDMQALRKSLNETYLTGEITQGEMERRERKLDTLVSKGLQIENAFSDGFHGENRSVLLGGDLGDRPSSSWSLEEDDTTRVLTVDELRQQQQLAIQEQDKGLDSLYNAVVRQKQMAQNIGEELDIHNDIIDDIADHTDRTRDRLIKETRHVDIVDRKSNTCIYWVVIILLFISIIVVIAVPA